jgi:hypothetical protein
MIKTTLTTKKDATLAAQVTAEGLVRNAIETCTQQADKNAHMNC